MKDTHTTHIIKVAGIITLCAVAGWLYLFVAETLYENTANKHWQSSRYKARAANPGNIRLVDSCTQLLQTGDLVVRRGDDMTSYMLAKLNPDDKTYSHCGIVVMEEGQPFVYHCIGGEDNPDAKMKRETAVQWFSPDNNHGFAAYRYNFKDSETQRLTKQLHTYYKQRVMFDMDFDLDTDDRLYCSEMVYKTICAATRNQEYFITDNSYGRRIIAIDRLYRKPETRQVCQVRFK